jgi:S1-C subfamily serine protease
MEYKSILNILLKKRRGVFYFQVSCLTPDKREFSAELIGRDPNTDLAL